MRGTVLICVTSGGSRALAGMKSRVWLCARGAFFPLVESAASGRELFGSKIILLCCWRGGGLQDALFMMYEMPGWCPGGGVLFLKVSLPASMAGGIGS